MLRLVTTMMLLMVPSMAAAWEPNGYVVPPNERPIRWSIGTPDVADLTSEQVVIEVQAAFDNWEQAHCGVTFEFLGVQEYADLTQVPEGQLHLAFAPLGRGVWWTPLGPEPDDYKVFERDGVEYKRRGMRPVVFNTDLGFSSAEEIASEGCFQQYSMTTVVSQFLGETLGLQTNRSARGVMQVPVPYCAVVAPNEDDVQGIDVLYGPYVSLTCSNPDQPSQGDGEVNGSVPFDVTCSAVGDASSTPTNATWSFGDGSAKEGVDIEHTLTKADNVKLWATVEGEHTTCGQFVRRVERFTYIRACDVPAPSFRTELYRELTYQLLNQSDVSVFGCHQNVRWLAFDESGEQVFESSVWEPRVTFLVDGVYTIRLVLTGVAGEIVVEQVLDTSQSPTRPFTMGNGCNAVGGGGAGGVALWALLLLVSRRRRSV